MARSWCRAPLADLDHIWLRAYINETDIGKIRLDQTATVKTDTHPGKSYKGRVSFISSAAEFTPKSVETHAERVTLAYWGKRYAVNAAEYYVDVPYDQEAFVRARVLLLVDYLNRIQQK